MSEAGDSGMDQSRTVRRGAESRAGCEASLHGTTGTAESLRRSTRHPRRSRCDDERGALVSVQE